MLDKIGIEKARTDFRYWEAMQKKYGAEGPGLGGPGLSVVVRAPRPKHSKIENRNSKIGDEQEAD